MSTNDQIPGFRRHGRPGNYRAAVLLLEPDARAIAAEADADGAPVAGVLRRAVRFYLARRNGDADPRQ